MFGKKGIKERDYSLFFKNKNIHIFFYMSWEIIKEIVISISISNTSKELSISTTNNRVAIFISIFLFNISTLRDRGNTKQLRKWHRNFHFRIYFISRQNFFRFFFIWNSFQIFFSLSFNILFPFIHSISNSLRQNNFFIIFRQV